MLVLHERKSRVTLAARLAGKTAAETISVMLAVFARIEPALRKSITFDNDTAFAQHALLRTMRAMTTWFCDAYASWQKGGVENANGPLRRWLWFWSSRGATWETTSQPSARSSLTVTKCALRSLATAVEPTSDAQRAMQQQLQTHKDGAFSAILALDGAANALELYANNTPLKDHAPIVQSMRRQITLMSNQIRHRAM